MQLIILAAGMGTRLRPLTLEQPKCNVSLGNKSLLEWQLQAAQSVGIEDILLVGGHKYQSLEKFNLPIIINNEFETTNMAYSLYTAIKSINSNQVIISYGDIVYNNSVLKRLSESTESIVLPIDQDWLAYWNMRFQDPLSDAESLLIDGDGFITEVGKKAQCVSEIKGQYIGISMFQDKGVEILKSTLEHLNTVGNPPELRNMYMTQYIQWLIDHQHKVKSLPINGNWLEIDSISDLELSKNIFKNRLLNYKI